MCHFQALSLVRDQVPCPLSELFSWSQFALAIYAISSIHLSKSPYLICLSPSVSIAAAAEDLFFPMLIIVYGRSVVMAASSIPSPALCQFDLNRMNPDYAETL